MRIINGDTYINDAKVIATDWLIYNGVLHIIDKWVLINRFGFFDLLNNIY